MLRDEALTDAVVRNEAYTVPYADAAEIQIFVEPLSIRY